VCYSRLILTTDRNFRHWHEFTFFQAAGNFSVRGAQIRSYTMLGVFRHHSYVNYTEINLKICTVFTSRVAPSSDKSSWQVEMLLIHKNSSVLNAEKLILASCHIWMNYMRMYTIREVVYVEICMYYIIFLSWWRQGYGYAAHATNMI
jgi:hypothetical protein